MYYYHENESNSYPPTEIYEDVFANDYDASGFYFVRGPNIYATEVGGTTYFIQEAIPVPLLGLSYNYSNDLSSFSDYNGEIYHSINQNEGSYHEHTSQDFAVERYEEPRVNENDVSDLSNITSGYTFMRGPNVYASEVWGTTYFVQDAIPIPVFSIAGSIQPSYSDDVSHPSSPISSDVFDVENLALNSAVCYSESNENVEIYNGQTSSVKCKEDCHSERNIISKRKAKTIKAKAEKPLEHKSSVKMENICNLELNEIAKKLERHESSVERLEFHYLGVNKKLNSISESLQRSYLNDVSHESSPKSSDVLNVQNISSSKSVICYTESNEKVEISNGQTGSVKCKEKWHSEKDKRRKRKVKAIKAKDKILVDRKSLVKTEDICNMELTERIKGLDSHKCSFENDESCNLNVHEKMKHNSEIDAIKEKKSEENKNRVIHSQVSILYTNEESVKLDNSKKSIKGNNECNVEENKRNKRKIKKRKAKERKLEESDNAGKRNQSWNSESNKNVQQKEETEMSIKSNELCNLEGNVKNENLLQDEFYCVKRCEDLTLEKKKKKKKKRKTKTKIKETIEIKSFSSTNEVSNTDFNEKDQKSDKSKMSVNFHEHCNLEVSKTVKRKSNVKISIEHECSVKGNAASIQNKNSAICNEVCKIDIIETIQIAEECKMSIKTHEICNLEANKASKKKIKKRKRKGKKISEHQSNDHLDLNEGNILSTTKTDLLLNINGECSIVENIDSSKTFDSSRETKIASTYVSECDMTKNAKEEGEKNTCTPPSSVEILHTNSNALFDIPDQKLLCVSEKAKSKHVDDYPVSTSKTAEDPNKQSNVQFQECNSPSDVPVTETDISYKDSPSSSPTTKAAKKKRFHRIRKWFNGLFSCVRKNKD